MKRPIASAATIEVPNQTTAIGNSGTAVVMHLSPN
jgi:hypothetical protein